MTNDPVDLKTAIERQHGGVATFVRSKHVTEWWEGQIAWDGVVQIFDLKAIKMPL
jgi:hypothetical protein